MLILRRSVYELLINQSLEGFLFHLRGVGALLKQAGLPSLEATTPHSGTLGFPFWLGTF